MNPTDSVITLLMVVSFMLSLTLFGDMISGWVTAGLITLLGFRGRNIYLRDNVVKYGVIVMYRFEPVRAAVSTVGLSFLSLALMMTNVLYMEVIAVLILFIPTLISTMNWKEIHI